VIDEISEEIEVSSGSWKFITRHLGMLTFQLQNGKCYWWDDDYICFEEQLQFYVHEVLGPDWHASIGLAKSAVFISLANFLYMTTYCCPVGPSCDWSLLALVTMIIQCLTFLLNNSQWFENKNCSSVGRLDLLSQQPSCFTSRPYLLYYHELPWG
jgi:hypothetical protein